MRAKNAEIRKVNMLGVTADKQGAGNIASPLFLRLRARSVQRAPAAAAMAGAPTFTLICFGFASSRFGMLSVSTPF